MDYDVRDFLGGRDPWVVQERLEQLERACEDPLIALMPPLARQQSYQSLYQTSPYYLSTFTPDPASPESSPTVQLIRLPSIRIDECADVVKSTNDSAPGSPSRSISSKSSKRSVSSKIGSFIKSKFGSTRSAKSTKFGAHRTITL